MTPASFYLVKRFSAGTAQSGCTERSDCSERRHCLPHTSPRFTGDNGKRLKKKSPQTSDTVRAVAHHDVGAFLLKAAHDDKVERCQFISALWSFGR